MLDSTSSAPAGKGLSLLTLGAIGVVFGDIGTSPLYAFQAAFGEALFQNTQLSLIHI